MKKLFILGSGRGENFEAIVKYLNSLKISSEIEITCLSDNIDSDILKRAEALGIKHKYLPFEENFEFFAGHDFDLAVLSGYSRELDAEILQTGTFLNLHPSLLPAFKGHDAITRAFQSGVKISGVTVHYLTNEIGGGKIIAQYPVLIGNLTHFDEFEESIRKLENLLYPIVIEKVLEDKVFDFSDLFSGGCGGNSGGCSGCRGCH